MLPPIADVRATAEAYRDWFWPGLVLPAIEWAGLPAAEAAYDAPTARYPHGRIRLARRLGGTWEWRACLLHELVHAALEPWVGEAEYPDGRVPYHGPAFVAECNRIGGLLGLPYLDADDGYGWPWLLLQPEYDLDVDQ